MSDEDQDWRLHAQLDREGGVHRVVGRFRGPGVVGDVEKAVASDVVITHDGQELFAYASTRPAIDGAREAILGVLDEDGVGADMKVSHWDDELDEWVQVDPPLAPEEVRRREAAEEAAEDIETRTLVAKAGRLVRGEFEETMLAAANGLGLECKIIEHPHLLSSQVAFTVTGPRGDVEEFARGLKAEGWAFVRAESWLMSSGF